MGVVRLNKKGAGIAMTWNQAICGNCWDKREPNRRAVVATDMNPERCAYCNAGTREGIYVRDDPATVPYPTVESSR